MKLVQIHTSLYLTEHPAEVYEVRGAVILGKERVAVWDTLLHPDNMASVAELSQSKPITVVYSHADWDHVWGTAGLDYQEVIGHESCKERFEDANDVAAVLKQKVAQDAGYNSVQLVAPTRTFRNTLTFDLGGLNVELHHLPGHTRDCAVAFIPDLGVLLGGDAVEVPFPLVYEHSPLGIWISKLEGWARDERIQTVIPSHGTPGDRELLERNIAYLRALREGQQVPVPDNLNAFYQGAHEKNQQRAVQDS